MTNGCLGIWWVRPTERRKHVVATLPIEMTEILWMSRVAVVTAGLAMALAACGGAGNDASSAPAPTTVSTVASSTTVTPEPTTGSTSATAPPGLATGQLMFSRFDESTHSFISTHLINPDGSGEVELPLPGPEGGGRWSHDGSVIAVMTILDDDRVGTAVIQPDGTVNRTLEISDETLNLVCTVWSPDDLRLACEGWDDSDPTRAGIYTVLSADGGDLTRLTFPPGGSHDLPGDYSPDGTELVFKRMRGEGPGPLLIVDVAGGEPLAVGEADFEDAGRFSSDGETLLISAGGRIELVDRTGDVQLTIEEPGAFLFGPVWSPDGQWIAYSQSNAEFRAEIIVSRPDGLEPWQVTHTAANEIDVEWGLSP
jgi:hypothetical protein